MAFLTFFSEDYLPRAHTLLDSIYRFQPDARVIACILDAPSLEICNSFPKIELFSLDQALATNADALSAAQSRTGADAIFTAVPTILRFALGKLQPNEKLLYLDSDTCLLSHPRRVFQELGTHEVGLFPHDFSGVLSRRLSRYGLFNAGAILLRNSSGAHSFLEAWQLRCNDWLEDRVDGNRYANQGYLTELAQDFDTCTTSIVYSAGNIAPWNASNRHIQLKQSGVAYKGSDISFFHYHGVSNVGPFWVTGGVRYFKFLSSAKLRAIYTEYLQRLGANQAIYKAKKALPRFQKRNFVGRTVEFFRLAMAFLTLQVLLRK